MSNTPWYEGPLLGFDTETTGINVKEDRIVQAGLAGGTGRIGDPAANREWLINPGIPIHPGATGVHGISDAMVEKDGIDPKIALAEVADALRGTIEDNIPVIIYNAPFDITLLQCELERYGLEPLNIAQLVILDPLVLDKQVDKYRKGKRTLGVTADHYGVGLNNAHSAVADCVASIGIARELGRRYPALGNKLPQELHIAQVDWYAKDKAGFEKWLESKGKSEKIDQRWPYAP